MLYHQCSLSLFKNLIIIFAILFISHYIFKSRKTIEQKEFQIIFKDVNIKYKYFGFKESNVLIASISRPNSSDLRMQIRNSWKRDIPTTFTHRFFIGLTQNETMQEINEEEAEKYGDIVFTSIIDSDLNQTLQMSAIFQWQQKFFPKVDYFLKVDETSVLDVSRFQYWLNLKFNMFKSSYNDSIIFGNLLQNGIVVRDPNEKRYVPYDIYNKPNFPSYQHGSCYLTTPNTIKLMIEEAKNHKYISFDNAFFTGIIAEKVKATRINANRHFASQNPLTTNSWDQECDDDGVPFLFIISDENGEIINKADGYINALKKLKGLKCSSEN